MKVAVSGTRRSEREADVRRAFEELGLGPGDVVVHGACHLGGVDAAADRVARELGCEVRPYPVDHEVDGPWPRCGPKRNVRMLKAEQPAILLAFPDQRSRGTRHAISAARALMIETRVYEEEDR